MSKSSDRERWEVATYAVLWLAIVVVLALSPGKRRKDAPPPPEPGPPPLELSPRSLAAAAPDLAGRVVVVGTAGFEPTHDPREFAWRRWADKPPELVLSFREPPGSLPPRVRGVVTLRPDGTPALADCRAE